MESWRDPASCGATAVCRGARGETQGTGRSSLRGREGWRADVAREGPRGSPICLLSASQCPLRATDLGAELRTRKEVQGVERRGLGTVLIFAHEGGETSSRPSRCKAPVPAPSVIVCVQPLFVLPEVSWQTHRAHVESAVPPAQSSDCSHAEPPPGPVPLWPVRVCHLTCGSPATLLPSTCTPAGRGGSRPPGDPSHSPSPRGSVSALHDCSR